MMTALASHRTEAKVLLRKEAVDCGVLVLEIPAVSRFLSFIVIAQGGKIAYLTVYAALVGKSPPIAISADALPKDKAATKVVWKHCFDMFSRQAAKIAPLYTDDAVVISNLGDEPCVGHQAIYDFCDKLMNTFSTAKILGYPG